MSLATAVKAVEDAIVQTLIDGAITGVSGIVFNRELRNGTMKPPYLRIFPEPSPIASQGIKSIAEDWFYRFTIVAVAAAYESKDQDQARDIALQAGSLFITGTRDLNGLLTGGDVVRILWDSDYTKELPTGQLFGAAVTLEARFINREI